MLKNYRQLNLKIILFFILPFFLFQRLVLAKTFSQIYDLSGSKEIFGLNIDGKVKLDSDSSFVRVILVDIDKKEYLVYEINSLLADSNNFSVSNVCSETCILGGIVPDHLRIEGENSSFEVSKVNMSSRQNLGVTFLGFENEKRRLANVKEQEIVQKLNEQIKKKGMNWVAGETSVSGLSYEEKKKLFRLQDGTLLDTLPNLQGFEYYKGGVFELKSGSEQLVRMQEATPSALPSSWDWRNVHGENWMTTVKDQGVCGSCWAFSAIGATESLINLYYNQHLDTDLSEQNLVSCIYPDGCNGGSPGTALEYIKNNGVVDEKCFSYRSSEGGCSNKCESWQNNLFKINDMVNYKYQRLDEEQLKRLLIQKGPLGIAVSSMSHAMMLIGYKGRTDWKLLESCQGNKICAYNEGCVSRNCNTPGEELSICSSNFNNPGMVQTGKQNTFVCKDSGDGIYRWEFDRAVSCPGIDVCLENKCQDRSKMVFDKGMTECSYGWDYVAGRPVGTGEFWQYLPGEGPNYWIFKDSWGVSWGENGYSRIAVQIDNLSDITFPLGPFVFPSDSSVLPDGFDGEIKCVDKDNDTYCNWGISETKPSTCPALCKPEKDCDDSNSTLGPFDQNLNCTTLGSCTVSNGNANGDTKVDLLDFEIWRREKNGILQTKRADFNCLNGVDMADFDIWRSNFQ